jgi:hypothetical protein
VDTTALAAFLDVLVARGVTEYAGPGPSAPGSAQAPQWMRVRLFAGTAQAKPAVAAPPRPGRPELPKELKDAGVTPEDAADLYASLEG